VSEINSHIDQNGYKIVLQQHCIISMLYLLIFIEKICVMVCKKLSN